MHTNSFLPLLLLSSTAAAIPYSLGQQKPAFTFERRSAAAPLEFQRRSEPSLAFHVEKRSNEPFTRRSTTDQDLQFGILPASVPFARRSTEDQDLQFHIRRASDSAGLAFEARSPAAPALSFALKPRSQPLSPHHDFTLAPRGPVSCRPPSDRPQMHPVFDDALLAVDTLRYASAQPVAGDGCVYLAAHGEASVSVCGPVGEAGVTWGDVYGWGEKVLLSCAQEREEEIPLGMRRKRALEDSAGLAFRSINTDPETTRRIGRREIKSVVEQREELVKRVGGSYTDVKSGIRVEIYHS